MQIYTWLQSRRSNLLVKTNRIFLAWLKLEIWSKEDEHCKLVLNFPFLWGLSSDTAKFNGRENLVSQLPRKFRGKPEKYLRTKALHTLNSAYTYQRARRPVQTMRAAVTWLSGSKNTEPARCLALILKWIRCRSCSCFYFSNRCSNRRDTTHPTSMHCSLYWLPCYG